MKLTAGLCPDTCNRVIFSWSHITIFYSKYKWILYRVASSYSFQIEHMGPKNAERFIVVAKRFKPWELVEHLLANNDESDMYRLIRPTQLWNGSDSERKHALLVSCCKIRIYVWGAFKKFADTNYHAWIFDDIIEATDLMRIEIIW